MMGLEAARIPNGWAQTSLEAVCQILDSRRIPLNSSERSRRIAGKSADDLYPYYGATGQVGVIDDFIFDGEHVLLGEDGAPFLDPFKVKSYLVGGKFWVNNHAHILKAAISNRYLSRYLNQIDYSDYVTGTTRLKLTQNALKRIPVLVAPTAEQHRIVTKIEELFSELDKGIESLKTARAKLNVYRQAVLKHAFEGKLTAQWRGEHLEAKPASELLQRILVERRRGWEENQLRKFAEKGKAPSKNWKAKYKEPATADTTDLPLLPDSWCWSSIDQLIREPLRNGHSAVASQTDGGIPTFSISAVTDGDFSAKNIKMTSADPLKVQDLWIESDDIFVQRSNTPELVGTARRYRGENGRAIFPDLLIRIRVTSSVLSAFVELALQSVRCHAYFRHKSQGISGSMPKIDQDVVRLAAIPIPPLPEQEAIIEAVEGQLTVIDHIEAEIDGQLLKADSLRQSVLKKAFAGELVPQDPRDEPASVLLDRIRAEREKAAKNNHAKKTKKRKAAA